MTMFNIQTKASNFKTVNKEFSSLHHHHHNHHHNHHHHHPHQQKASNLNEKSVRFNSDHLNESSSNCPKHSSQHDIHLSDATTSSKNFNPRNLLTALRFNFKDKFTELLRNIKTPKGK